MVSKEFFSTGDASSFLKISRATVSRKFDAGVLEGKKNPITGERLISHESLISFMKKYNLPLDALEAVSSKYLVLLCSQDKHFKSLINQSFPPEGIIRIFETVSIYDAIIICTKNPPELFIIDDEFPCSEIVKSLKQHEELKNMKILCCLKTYNRDRLTDINADDYFAKDTMDITSLVNKVNTILNITKETQPVDARFDHNRQWPRINVNIPANLQIYLVKTPQSRERGNSRIENISLGGAYLNNIHLERGKIPFENFRILLEIDQPPLNDWKAECKVVRLQINGSFNAGVKFVDLSESNRNQIAELVG